MKGDWNDSSDVFQGNLKNLMVMKHTQIYQMKRFFLKQYIHFFSLNVGPFPSTNAPEPDAIATLQT